MRACVVSLIPTENSALALSLSPPLSFLSPHAIVPVVQENLFIFLERKQQQRNVLLFCAFPSLLFVGKASLYKNSTTKDLPVSYIRAGKINEGKKGKNSCFL